MKRKERKRKKIALGRNRKSSNINGTITGYLGIEAIFDAFGIVVDSIERFETALRFILHIALPTVYRMISKLDGVLKGNQVWRGEGKAFACPSLCSRELCRVLAAKLHENRWDYQLMLVGSYLNPLFREMDFVADARLSMENR